MVYNEKTQQLEITIDEVLELTNYDSSDIYEHNIDLGQLSRATYQYIASFYKGPNPERHFNAIKKLIEDEPQKQQTLKQAIVEVVKGALVSGMDLNAYIANLQNEHKEHVPHTVKEELRYGGLYFPGEIIW